MSDTIREAAVEAAGITVGKGSMYGGAGTGLVGALASVDWLGAAGFLLAIAGFAVNLYFQKRRDRREAAEHAARMEAIRANRER